MLVSRCRYSDHAFSRSPSKDGRDFQNTEYGQALLLSSSPKPSFYCTCFRSPRSPVRNAGSSQYEASRMPSLQLLHRLRLLPQILHQRHRQLLFITMRLPHRAHLPRKDLDILLSHLDAQPLKLLLRKAAIPAIHTKGLPRHWHDFYRSRGHIHRLQTFQWM